jgi:hypothetical protein
MLLVCTFAFCGYQTVKALPVDNLMLYVTSPEGNEFIIGEQANISLVFKNYKNTTTESLYNVTIEFKTHETLNITNLFDQPVTNATTYNVTNYLLDQDATTPYYWWNGTLANITIAEFIPNRIFIMWYIVNGTEAINGASVATPFTISYVYNNETFFDETIGRAITLNIIEEPSIPRLQVPIRGDFTWFWWLFGGIAVAVPAIIVIITRLTLWKR